LRALGIVRRHPESKENIDSQTAAEALSSGNNSVFSNCRDAKPTTMSIPVPHPSKHPALAPAVPVTLEVAEPLKLDSGTLLGPTTVAYRTYGTLNAAKSNAILICHALTGDQYVAERHPITGKPGWWESLAGPGKVLDSNRYFLICANVLGGCMGSTGPMELNPETGKPWGLSFPVITIADMVRAQKHLIDHLGIDTLFCVIGGSMGGMQVLQWAASYPERVFSAVPIACAARHSAQNIAFHEVGRQAIMADPDWAGGNYQLLGKKPSRGLAVARMAAHITYLSEPALHRKFGRNLQNREALGFGFDADFQVEGYLRHQGITFVERFDANSYLYITRACDYFDIAAEHGGVLANAFTGSKSRFCVISFTSDWLYPTSENREIVHALNAAAANVSFVEVATDKGHDAFLLEEPELFATLRGFLDGCAQHRGLTPA
jgi:homoserine O-acetyltransferase